MFGGVPSIQRVGCRVLLLPGKLQPPSGFRTAFGSAGSYPLRSAIRRGSFSRPHRAAVATSCDRSLFPTIGRGYRKICNPHKKAAFYRPPARTKRSPYASLWDRTGKPDTETVLSYDPLKQGIIWMLSWSAGKGWANFSFPGQKGVPFQGMGIIIPSWITTLPVIALYDGSPRSRMKAHSVMLCYFPHCCITLIGAGQGINREQIVTCGKTISSLRYWVILMQPFLGNFQKFNQFELF